jgi:hypothetical protein
VRGRNLTFIVLTTSVTALGQKGEHRLWLAPFDRQLRPREIPNAALHLQVYSRPLPTVEK